MSASPKSKVAFPSLVLKTFMSKPSPQPKRAFEEASRNRRLDMQHLLIIEGNPLTADEIAMFEMFEREVWSHERRRDYIFDMFQSMESPEEAE